MRWASINRQLLDVNENKLKIQFNYESDYIKQFGENSLVLGVNNG